MSKRIDMPKRGFKNPRQRSDSRHFVSNRRPARSTAPPKRGGNVIADARQQYERYLALAHAAVLNGDDVEAQNCYQHAEHFFRQMTGRDA